MLFHIFQFCVYSSVSVACRLPFLFWVLPIFRINQVAGYNDFDLEMTLTITLRLKKGVSRYKEESPIVQVPSLISNSISLLFGFGFRPSLIESTESTTMALVTIPPYWIRSLDLEMKTRQYLYRVTMSMQGNAYRPSVKEDSLRVIWNRCEFQAPLLFR